MTDSVVTIGFELHSVMSVGTFKKSATAEALDIHVIYLKSFILNFFILYRAS
jgi:hypothetical protein